MNILNSKYISKLLVILALLLPFNFIIGCDNELPIQPKHDYYIFIDTWNERLDKIKGSSSFKLDSGNNLYSKLRQWSHAFANKPSHELINELEKLEQEMPATTFNVYEKFKAKHYTGIPLRLDDGLDDSQLAQNLNQWLGIVINGRAPDYVTMQTVKDIVYMNSLCAYFLNEKENLHKAGIDTGIETCSQLSTHGRFPWLDALVDSDRRSEIN